MRLMLVFRLLAQVNTYDFCQYLAFAGTGIQSWKSPNVAMNASMVRFCFFLHVSIGFASFLCCLCRQYGSLITFERGQICKKAYLSSSVKVQLFLRFHLLWLLPLSPDHNGEMIVQNGLMTVTSAQLTSGGTGRITLNP
jgi:hypothetical protein